MKTYEEFKLKNLFFKKEKEEIPKEKEEEDITLEEMPPVTIMDIFNKFGGLDNFNYNEVSKYLGFQYNGKNIKLVYDNDEEKKIPNVFKVVLSVFYHVDRATNEVNIDFYSNPGVKLGISGNTKIIVLVKRKISDVDPYGEEIIDD